MISRLIVTLSIFWGNFYSSCAKKNALIKISINKDRKNMNNAVANPLNTYSNLSTPNVFSRHIEMEHGL